MKIWRAPNRLKPLAEVIALYKGGLVTLSTASPRLVSPPKGFGVSPSLRSFRSYRCPGYKEPGSVLILNK